MTTCAGCLVGVRMELRAAVLEIRIPALISVQTDAKCPFPLSPDRPAAGESGFTSVRGSTLKSTMSNTYVPMIPCHVAGPLGVLHLPRLWQKVSLEACGKLAAGYPGIGKGFDSMVIAGLGLSADAVKAFVAGKRPSYAEFETWVKAQPGVKLDRASVYKLNQSILGYHHGDDTRKGILAAAGYPDDGSVLGAAVELNALDDWAAFHAEVLK